MAIWQNWCFGQFYHSKLKSKHLVCLRFFWGNERKYFTHTPGLNELWSLLKSVIRGHNLSEVTQSSQFRRKIGPKSHQTTQRARSSSSVELSGPESRVPKCYLRYSNAKKISWSQKLSLTIFLNFLNCVNKKCAVYLMTF